MTVGGSWLASPMSTSCRHFLAKATSVAGSVLWVHSSTSTRSNSAPWNEVPPAPTQVLTTTWCCLMASLTACASVGVSSASMPTRMHLTPSRRMVATRLAAAAFESATASTFVCGSMMVHARTMAAAVWVLPVPGGPCMIVSLCLSDFSSASRCPPTSDVIVIPHVSVSSQSIASTPLSPPPRCCRTTPGGPLPTSRPRISVVKLYESRCGNWHHGRPRSDTDAAGADSSTSAAWAWACLWPCRNAAARSASFSDRLFLALAEG
mmetsp:Transcript_4817/g.12995  ORF Transcript_4817/g.12995 Transcript_4817/m.12995 type:complete len:264 (-) Transcript_4817:1564-2355(-)